MSQDPYHPPTIAPNISEAEPASNTAKRFLQFFLATLTLGCVGLLVISFVIPMQRRGLRPAALRMQCSNNLRHVSLALLEYAAEYNSFPPAVLYGPDGQPMHSWRVLILPYVDQVQLFESIDLSKPWDDPVNASAYDSILPIFQCRMAATEPTHTCFQAILSDEGVFPPKGSRQSIDLSDPTAATLMLVEVPASDAVHWMQPTDCDAKRFLEMNDPTQLNHGGGIHCAFADGQVRFLPIDTPEENRSALLTVAGEEVDPAAE